MLDFFGHIGYFLLVIGQLCLTKKYIVGWILRFCGELTWTIIGLIMNMSSIWIWGIIFMFVDLKGFINWKKNIDKLDSKI